MVSSFWVVVVAVGVAMFVAHMRSASRLADDAEAVMRGGRYRLGREAYHQLCEQVRLRAEYRCELCTRTAPIQVHHIRPRSQGGGDIELNLVALCHRCHEKMDGGGWKKYETLLRDRAIERVSHGPAQPV